jgi:biopolymer transport protein TolR
MRAESSPAVQALPNVTPMIDVMLVLLVIFMVTAPSMLDGIRAVPPAAEHAANRPAQEEDQVVGIDGVGRYYLNKRPIAKELLATALRSIYSTRHTDKVLYIRAQKSVQYGAVLDVMDAAAKNGVAVVGMITEQLPASQRHSAASSSPR